MDNKKNNAKKRLGRCQKYKGLKKFLGKYLEGLLFAILTLPFYYLINCLWDNINSQIFSSTTNLVKHVFIDLPLFLCAVDYIGVWLFEKHSIHKKKKDKCYVEER